MLPHVALPGPPVSRDLERKHSSLLTVISMSVCLTIPDGNTSPVHVKTSGEHGCTGQHR